MSAWDKAEAALHMAMDSWYRDHKTACSMVALILCPSTRLEGMGSEEDSFPVGSHQMEQEGYCGRRPAARCSLSSMNPRY